MEYREIGTSGLLASVVGLGTWVTGGGVAWGENPEDAESIRAVQASLDQGVNLIDTAPAYGWGRSEEVVGRAIKGRRDKVLLATKCGLWWDDDRGSYFCEFDGRAMRRSLRADTIAIELERSLRRLGTTHIDLYQTHWPAVPPDQTPIADTMACLMKLKQQGKIRALGVSNVSMEELRENCAHGEVASAQLRYSMLHRAPESDMLPFCRENRLETLTYMSLEQGLLTGRVGMDRVFSPSEFRASSAWNPWFIPENRARVLDLLAGWSDLTCQFDCTMAQLVIAWTAQQPGVTHVLCGARRSAQAVENAAAGGLVLGPETLARMRRDIEALGQPSATAVGAS